MIFSLRLPGTGSLLRTCAAISLFAVQGMLGAEQPSRSSKAEQASELNSLLTQAPPEVQADAILRMVEHYPLPRKEQLEMLEQAFRLASFATESVRRVAAVSSARLLGDTDAAILYRAGSLGLDRLSLQSRTVLLAVRLAPAQAKKWHDSIQLEPPPVNCEDALVPDPSLYYSAIEECLKYGFSDDRAHSPGREAWLESKVRLTDGSQIAPLASLLADLDVSKSNHGAIVLRLASEIQALSPRPRLFLATWQQAGDAVLRLAAAVPPARAALMLAFSGYLSRGLALPRCADEWPDKKDEEAALRWIAEWNDTLKSHGLAEYAVDPQLVNARSREFGRASVTAFADFPGYSRLLSDYSALRFGTPDQQAKYEGTASPGAVRVYLPLDERKKIPWIEAASRFVKDLESWRREAKGSSLAIFAMSSALYMGLVEIIPPDEPFFQQVVYSYLRFLQNTEVRSSYPAVWLMAVKDLVGAGSLRRDRSPLDAAAAAASQLGDSTMGALVHLEELTKDSTSSESPREKSP